MPCTIEAAGDGFYAKHDWLRLKDLKLRSGEYRLTPKFTKNPYQWLFKVLGGCVYCFGTWVAIVFYMIVLGDFRTLIPTIIGLFLFIGMNYFWTEVIQKIKRI